MSDSMFEGEVNQESEWFEKTADPVVKRDLLEYNPILLSNKISSAPVDGFYFWTSDNYVFLIDNKNGKIRINPTKTEFDFALNDKINQLNVDGKKLFFDNKVIIRDNKTFYHILSWRQSLILRIMAIFPFIKRKIIPA